MHLIRSAISTNTLGDRARRSRQRVGLGVPQGLPISNILAEIYLMDVDRKMENIPGLAYFRYVDDVLVLCQNSDQSNLMKIVPDIFSDVGLITHEFNTPNSKSHAGTTSEAIEFLGYLFHGNLISVRKSSVDVIESSLARIFIQYQKSLREKPKDAIWRQARLEECLWRLNLRISGCIYESKPRGWLNYFSQLNDLVLLKRRDASVKRLIKRFNMPSTFRPKTFTRTYWHIRNPNKSTTDYILTLDKLNIAQMRWVLETVFRVDKKLIKSDKKVRLRYRFEIVKFVSELELDVRMVS